jgi:ABC-type transport system involved in multi-copper enzyme maturation permease subunit
LLWLTWRQYRTQVLVTSALLLVLGVVLLVNGLLANPAENHGLTSCLRGGGDCVGGDTVVSDRFDNMYPFVSSLILVPAFVGVFWGAPLLSKEFERGTHKLVWTQSVSRPRWLLAKLGGVGLMVALSGLVFGLIIEAWLRTFPGKARPLDDIALFSLVGVVSVAWWLFAFVLGAAAGAILRKTLPAVGVTIAVSVAVLAGLVLLRPHYVAPERVELTGAPQQALQDAYLVRSGLVGPDGREYPSGVATPDCPQGFDMGSCLDAAGYRNFFEYQPFDRFWRFQWTEAGILFAGTLLLGGVAVFGTVRRRV